MSLWSSTDRGSELTRSVLSRAREQSDDGDVIDCVNVYQQPAFKHVPPGKRALQVLNR
jgi:hypothetical protein